MISHTFLGRRIRKRRIRQHKPVYTTQERLRLTIEDLGPTYIKFGQILADRPDILSERFRKELKKLSHKHGIAVRHLYYGFILKMLYTVYKGEILQKYII